MYKVFHHIIFVIGFISILNGFEPDTYKCYNGGGESVFILYDTGGVVKKDYTSNRFRGLWIDYDDEAEITLQAKKIVHYLITPDKNGDKNMFIIKKIKNNINYRFCKAEKLNKDQD